MRLIELNGPPRAELEALGFKEYDEETTDPERLVWFRKHLFEIGSLNVIVEVKYNLSISDDPYATYDENCSYDFKRCTLITTHEEVEDNAISSDDDSYEQKTILYIQTLEELKSFIESSVKFGEFF